MINQGRLATQDQLINNAGADKFLRHAHARGARALKNGPSTQLLTYQATVPFVPDTFFPHVTRRFTSLVRRFLSAAEHRPQLLDSPAALDCFQNELTAATKDLFTRCQHLPDRNFIRWQCQTKSTAELALSHPDQSLSISDLARENGVPERSLRTAFQRCYGLSPMEYLCIHRLHRARGLLRASCPDETTVTQIAFGLGFWDVGRFAGAYRRLFGERPSETLRKPARVRIH